jgi:hypothetical protein
MPQQKNNFLLTTTLTSSEIVAEQIPEFKKMRDALEAMVKTLK